MSGLTAACLPVMKDSSGWLEITLQLCPPAGMVYTAAAIEPEQAGDAVRGYRQRFAAGAMEIMDALVGRAPPQCMRNIQPVVRQC
jgi:hypothetical protein